MRTLIESTLVFLDGVIEAPERWSLFDDEATAIATERLDHCDAFVMGRVTYEKFLRQLVPRRRQPVPRPHQRHAQYVAFRTLQETTWNAILLEPDPASAIARLKQQPGKDLI
jgi:dihydrofolate reductase